MSMPRLMVVILLGFLVGGCGKGMTYSLHLRYEPAKEFVSLNQKIGPTLGLASFKDERKDTLYIGYHTPYHGSESYFRCYPFPLEKAISETLSQALSRYGIKTIPVSTWDGKPESLKELDTDFILKIDIKRFWTEVSASFFRSKANTSVQLVIYLGVKKEGRVYTRNVEIEKESTFARLTPERIEEMVNQILTEIFDAFFSNPY